MPTPRCRVNFHMANKSMLSTTIDWPFKNPGEYVESWIAARFLTVHDRTGGTNKAFTINPDQISEITYELLETE